MLYTVFCLLTPSTILMLLCALYELTTHEHQRREQLFYPHLSKVFFSAIASFFTCVVFAHWLQQIADYSRRFNREYVDFQRKKHEILEELQQEYDTSQLHKDEINDYVKEKLNLRAMPEQERKQNKVRRFNPGHFKLLDYFDYMQDCFDLFLIKECEHLYSSDGTFKDVMRDIQTRAAAHFFVLIHVPLCKVHSAFSLISSLTPMMLNLKTKYWIYERTNDFVVRVFKGDAEAKNYVSKPAELCYDVKGLEADKIGDLFLSREEQISQENSVYATVVWLALYFSLLLNYFMSVYL